MTPDYIRLFATTTDDAMGSAAQRYLLSLLRIAPVRLISVSGGLGDSWGPFSRFLATPMTGELVNVVCTDPSNWTWLQRVPMSTKDLFSGAAAPEDLEDAMAAEAISAPTTEYATGTCELYTSGVRNVLIILSPPRAKGQVDAARRYDALLSADELTHTACEAISLSPVLIPPEDHRAIRRKVCG